MRRERDVSASGWYYSSIPLGADLRLVGRVIIARYLGFYPKLKSLVY